MRTRLVSMSVAVLAFIGLLALAPFPTSFAAISRTVVAHDRVGDVSTPRLHRRPARPLTLAQKLSIDIKRVTFQRVGRNVRITVALRRIVQTTKFDQMVHVSWRESRTARGGAYVGDVWTATRGQRGSASYYDPSPSGSSFTNCHATTAASTRYNRVAVTVPYACIPVGPLSITVQTLTGKLYSDAPVPSRDAVAVPGHPVFDDGLS